MDIDIPLPPGEEVSLSDIDPPDIPMPDDPEPLDLAGESTESTILDTEDIVPPLPPDPAPIPQENEDEDDPNRYSPSATIDEDDITIPAGAEVVSPLVQPPLPPPFLMEPISSSPRSISPPAPTLTPKPSTTSTTTRSMVLGKTQAKKRLLAFSQAKQGASAGVSFNLVKKPTINKESVKGFNEDKDDTKKKMFKKGSAPKVRDSISEIEELKRKEMMIMMGNVHHAVHPRLGVIDAANIPVGLPVKVAVGEVLIKKSKRELDKEKEKRRSRSKSEDRRRHRSKKSDRDKERPSRKKKVLPSSWEQFKKEKHVLYNFRRFKLDIEKRLQREQREKKRHRRSRTRSRSKSKEKTRSEKSSTGVLINLLDTPMVVKKAMAAENLNNDGYKDYPEHMVRFTKVKPSVSYCENPNMDTRHLIKRKQMLSTVPKNIEDIIVSFLTSIRPKRLRTKVDESKVKEDVEIVEKNDLFDNEGESIEAVSINVKQEDTTDVNIQTFECKAALTPERLSDENAKREEVASVEMGLAVETHDLSAKMETEHDVKHQEIKDSKGDIQEEVDILSEENLQKESPCHLLHRTFYQKEKDWLIIKVDMKNEEEDVEIEELDVIPTILPTDDEFCENNEFKNVKPSYDTKANYKPRVRHISQSSANAISEELEPIIKSAIRSKWDSDYEESEEENKLSCSRENIEKEVTNNSNEFVDHINYVSDDEQKLEDVSRDNLGVVPMEVEEEEKLDNDNINDTIYPDCEWSQENVQEDVSQDLLDEKQPDVVEKLASEYEEFMKMLGSGNQPDEEEVEKVSKNNESSNIDKVENDWEEETSEREVFPKSNSSVNNSEEQFHNESQDCKKYFEDLVPLEKEILKTDVPERSGSVSSSKSLNISNIKEAFLKHKISKALKKKKKTKVSASKLKRKKKFRGKKKSSRNKYKNSSSSDSSSSSSSSSSDSSSSSTTTTSDSSSDESTSDTSSSSESTSSSDSSIDLKKLKKQKLKKLQAKLKSKKKKKRGSSSASSNSSDDAQIEKKKKKRKKKGKLNVKTKKNKEKSAKKSKKIKDSTLDPNVCENSNDLVSKKQPKKKRKKVEDEEPDGTSKKKRIKLEEKLEIAKPEKKSKLGKNKKTKEAKELKKKSEDSKKMGLIKKKKSKLKLKIQEEGNDSSNENLVKPKKTKKQKKNSKKQKDLFLGFGESLKASEKEMYIVRDKNEDPECINKTGIRMSEEDFDIKPTSCESLSNKNCPSNAYKKPKDNCKPNTFLGQNKRLTEEDFEKELPEKSLQIDDHENKSVSYLEKEQIVTNVTSVDTKDKGKEKSKIKKEKKKKKIKTKDKDSNVTLKGNEKKKNKKGKERKIKNSKKSKIQGKDSFKLKTYSESNVNELQLPLSQNKNSGFQVGLDSHKIEAMMDLDSFQDNSIEKYSSKQTLSPSRKSGPINDWSDDSETRSSYLKQEKEKVISKKMLSNNSIEKRNVQLESENFKTNFDTSTIDYNCEVSSESKGKMGECEKMMEKLDESYRATKKVQENDGFFQTFLENSKKIDQNTLSEVNNDDQKNVSVIECIKVESKSKTVVLESLTLPNVTKSDPTKNDSTETVNDKTECEIFQNIEMNSNKTKNIPVPGGQVLDDNSKCKEGSERYSPTLDMDFLSPESVKENSDMSLDSTEEENVNMVVPGVDMLDIPLPPRKPLQAKRSTPPPLPVAPPPVPPPLMPVPPPSFKNILSMPSKHALEPEQPINTEFKSSVSEIIPIDKPTSLFTDPLRIPITKKLSFNKPAPKLKHTNIFEDDETEDDVNNERLQSKLPGHFVSDQNSKSSFDSIVEKVEEKLSKNCDPSRVTNNETKKELFEKSLIESKQETILKKSDKGDILNASKEESLKNSNLNISSANFEVENARDAWKDSEEAFTLLQPDLPEKPSGDEDNNQDNVSVKDERMEEQTNENVDNSNFNPNIIIKQEPESDASEEISSEKTQHLYPELPQKDENIVGGGDVRRNKDDCQTQKRKDLSRERKDRSRRGSSRERRRSRSRSRSRDKRRDRSRERHRRDSPDRRRRRDRSRERVRRSSPRDRRRERSPRNRRESSRERSPRRQSFTEDKLSIDKRDFTRSAESFKSTSAKQSSPFRRSTSPSKCAHSLSPRKRSPSPPLKSPSHQKKLVPSGINRTPSPFRSSPSRRVIPTRSPSPRRLYSPPKRPQSPHRRPSSPKSPRSPYNSPNSYRRRSSPGRRSSPWRPPSPLKKRSSSPGKRPGSLLKNSPSPVRKPLSPWRPPSPTNNPSTQYTGRNPSPLGFKRSLADSTISDSELPPIKKISRSTVFSPKRLPLDDRIELELGVKKSPPPPPKSNYPTYHSFYQVPMHETAQIPLMSNQQRRNSNLVQPPRLDWEASQQLMRQGKSTQVLQVGNILQVVPSEALPLASTSAPVQVPLQKPPPAVPVAPGPTQSTVVQVGNMLQVVPSALVPPVHVPTPVPAKLPLPLPLVTPSPPEATPPPPPAAVASSPLLLPLPVVKSNIKFDTSDIVALRRMEKEKKKKEKELKRQQKIAKHILRKALLLKDSYPSESELASQEEEQAKDLLDDIENIPEIMATPVKTKATTPLPAPPEKGILISPGFRDDVKVEKVRKSVSFADGLQPGEGEEAPSEEHPLSPPPEPKTKHFKKSKKKHKVKVKIIRVEDEEDDNEDDASSPPPPPPGSPPPMYHFPPPPPGFMYVPPQSFTVLQGTPVFQQHHSSTTTTHTTTVQFATAQQQAHPQMPKAKV